jgi:hypothetical protein
MGGADQEAQPEGRVSAAMRITTPLLVIMACLAAVPVSAQQRPTYLSLWEAIDRTNCVPDRQADLVLVTCAKDRTLWYFSLANHPADPAVMRRMIVQRNGDIFVETNGWSFASADRQPAFQTWLAQMKTLDQQMQQDLRRRNR